MVRCYILCFLCIGTIYTSKSQQIDYKKLENSLDSLIQTTMEEEHIPGAAFIIVKDGKTLLKKGYGYTSLGEDVRRVDPDSTIFRIGSVTKTFTATALLQLVYQKKGRSLCRCEPIFKICKSSQYL